MPTNPQKRPLAPDVLGQMTVEDLHEERRNGLEFGGTLRVNIERTEALYLRGVLRRTQGNITQAALWAGIDRNAFRRKCRKYGLIL